MLVDEAAKRDWSRGVKPKLNEEEWQAVSESTLLYDMELERIVFCPPLLRGVYRRPALRDPQWLRDGVVRKRRLKAKRTEATELLGNRCQGCGKKDGRLDLAHRVYAPDSARGGTSRDSLRRAQEALAHPERFYLLCPSCHKLYDTVRRYANGFDVVRESTLRQHAGSCY